MTDPHPNGTPIDEGSADRLSAAWNDIVADRSPAAGDADDELIHLARRLHAATTTVRERPDFRQSLRETIMHAPAASIPTTGLRPTHAGERPAPRPIPSIPAALRRTGARWLGLAATIALLLTTAAGAYLGGVGIPGNDGRAPSMAGFQDATPASDSSPVPAGSAFKCAFGDGESYSSPYLPCPELQEAVASTEVRGTFSPAAQAASTVQMQTWTVDGGASVSFRAPASTVAGVAVDFVLDGAYVATFDAPVTVLPAYVPQILVPVYTSVAAGEPVELTGGDIVSYEIGTRRTVSNPLAGTPLTLKTVLIHDGDPSPGNLVEIGEGPPVFMATVDGDGMLPMTIGEYGPLGPSLFLNHVRVFGGYPVPAEVVGLRVVMGPVGGLPDPIEVSGWVLWASTFVATA